MLFWMFVIIMVVGILFAIMVNKLSENSKYKFIYRNDVELYAGGVTAAIFSGIIVVGMLITIIIQNTAVDAQISKYNETYKTLVYKVENKNYRDEFGLLNKVVVDEVQEWNEDVAYYQEIHDDFWIGIFYPNIYDNFELIDLNKFEK